MALIGLTGGIASGKSTIGRRLEALGSVRIDADRLAREAVEPGSRGLRLVVERFGEEIIRDDGSLDRAALGERVFGDPEALADLNAIVHPEVRRLAERRVAEARAADPDAIIVYEVPLLVESGADMDWDLVVVADAPAETRVRRQVELRGLDEGDARRRVASQASDEERRAAADVVIDTSGDEARTIEQVDALWKRLTAR
ncbi:dephospho-CoA kinase [Leucobacter sp. CSA1]|uniref:Dephospho-CoA kinase n=1 Tax=Leucobacter chromiisoli TaxID=2796471 RepID=A0A934Q9L4_9MICO|nr:dephospho-CoA kinase [Leucobacter chromiisoli]MBK0419154.1 dephospho-CoA kinase [Leucobacter chromiisoli]